MVVRQSSEIVIKAPSGIVCNSEVPLASGSLHIEKQRGILVATLRESGDGGGFPIIDPFELFRMEADPHDQLSPGSQITGIVEEELKKKIGIDPANGEIDLASIATAQDLAEGIQRARERKNSHLETAYREMMWDKIREWGGSQNFTERMKSNELAEGHERAKKTC